MACGSPDTPADDDEECTSVPPKRAAVEGALTLGTTQNGQFHAYSEGEPAELVLGLQGGYMLLLSARIDAAALGSDLSCARLEVHPTVDSIAKPVLEVGLSPSDFDAEGTVEGLPLFLSLNLSELEDKPCHLSAVVRDDGNSSTSEVGVVLVWNH